MSIIYILIPVGTIIIAIGIYLFFWAVKTEQFDDLEKHGMSILFDEDIEDSKSERSNHEEKTSEDYELPMSKNKYKPPNK
jgi:cbb3-type cytochrome oxidase maturation protein